MKSHTINKKDFYDLRECLSQYYAGFPQFSIPEHIGFRELFGGRHYKFTRINENSGKLDFQLMISKYFRTHGIINFQYDDGNIEAKKIEKKVIFDKKTIIHIVNFTKKIRLGNITCKEIISNLDSLVI